MQGQALVTLALALTLGPLATAPPAAAAPPQDGWVVWQSTRSKGQSEIFRARADGSGVTQLTTGGGIQASWAPDGRWIAYADEQGSAAYLMRPDGSGVKKICAGQPVFWLHDNAGLVCRAFDAFNLVDPEQGTKQLIFSKSDFAMFQGKTLLPWPGGGGMTHDNRYLVGGTDLYRYGFSGANGTFKADFAAVVLDLWDHGKVYFFGNGCWPFTPPAGGWIYHICGDCPTKPDIYRMNLADLMTRSSYGPEVAHPDADWGHEYNPQVSNDGKWLAYMASTGCHSGYTCDYEIFLHELGSGVSARERVTNDTGFDGYPDLFIGQLWQAGASPWLALLPSKLEFVAADGTTGTSATVIIRNARGGTLKAAETAVSYARAGDRWLSVSVALAAGGAGGEQTLSASVDPQGLAAGEHKATIAISVANAGNSPVSCPVTLKVGQAALATDSGPAPDGGPAVDEPGGCQCRLGARSSGVDEVPVGVWLLALLLLPAAPGRRRGRRRAGADPLAGADLDAAARRRYLP